MREHTPRNELAEQFMELRCARSSELHAAGMTRVAASVQAEREVRERHQALAEAADLEQAEVNRCLAEHPALTRDHKARYRLAREAAELEGRWAPRGRTAAPPPPPVRGAAPRRLGARRHRRAARRRQAASSSDPASPDPPPRKLAVIVPAAALAAGYAVGAALAVVLP